MTIQGWQRHYLDALLRSRPQRAAQYENLTFLKSIFDEPADGIQELLLHRTIASLDSIDEALDLLTSLRQTRWRKYEPRILARIGDTEAVLQKQPELGEYFRILRERTGYTTYSIKDWKLIGDGYNFHLKDAPVWANRITPVTGIVEEGTTKKFGINEIAKVIRHFYEADVRIFQLALLTQSSSENDWAGILHKVLAAPFIEIGGEPHVPDSMVSSTPTGVWAPYWQLLADPRHITGWYIREVHTTRELKGLGSTAVYDQISVLLALSGLLREGIQLTPIDQRLVRSLTPSQPIWGFRRREFSAARTEYQADDVRALAMGFLEQLTGTTRVSMFRSRLAMRLVAESWGHRNSASVVTNAQGFYQQLVRAAQLFGQNRFQDVLVHIEGSPYQYEPAFRYFTAEAQAALDVLDRAEGLQHAPIVADVTKPHEILCVTHASVPDQTGGYAIRAHGILQSLSNAGISISAVTRPGFPTGALTQEVSLTVDGVEYRRLPATAVTRNHGEIQYIVSFIEPFKQLFQTLGVGIIHVRSTFLIALPALIAARELGLKVLYEVSGLWELVYQDREHSSHLLKRSAFAELAESLTMQQVDQLVVMNEAVRQIAIDRGVDETRIHIAPNAVNVEKFKPLALPTNEVFTIGYLGSFQDYEGLDDIVDAVKLLKQQGSIIRVLMVGDGLQYNPIRSRVRSEGLEEVVEFTGRVPHDEVPSYYEQMDILVYPRRATGATETITPLKPFEALALAKPIIVSDVYPLEEIVGDDQRGLVFENGNVTDFARAIRQLQQDHSLRERLGEAGRSWVVHNRSWDTVVATFVEAYSRLGLVTGGSQASSQ